MLQLSNHRGATAPSSLPSKNRAPSARPWILTLFTTLPLLRSPFLVAGVPPATLTVCPSGCDYTTIQAAVFAADPGDTVAVQIDGEHTEGPIVVIKNITIEGLGRDSTVVQQAVNPIFADNSVFQIGLGAVVTIRDMTIRYGRDPLVGCILINDADVLLKAVLITRCVGGRGGAILNRGVLTVVDSTIFHNDARAGGGIFNDSFANLWIENSVLELNRSDPAIEGLFSGGGGLFNQEQAQALIIDSWFIENQASNRGGGVVNERDGVLAIERTVFELNSADLGGGIHSLGSLVIQDSSLVDNSSTQGGGVHIGTSTPNPKRFTVSGTTFSANTAEDGGALWVLSVPLDLVNSTLSGNGATRHGGGIYVDSSEARLANVTITENIADSDADNQGDGGGIFSGDNTRAMNSLIVGNHDLSHPGFRYAPDCDGTLGSDGYNLIGNLGYTFIGGPPACTVGGPPGTDDIGVSEALGPLLDNGGPTQTHAILPGGLAVDTGNPDGCLDHEGSHLDDDQRGYLRPNRCDRGAYELGAYGPDLIFADGFESATTSSWSSEVP